MKVDLLCAEESKNLEPEFGSYECFYDAQENKIIFKSTRPRVEVIKGGQ
jgi:hypothetical protein